MDTVSLSLSPAFLLVTYAGAKFFDLGQKIHVADSLDEAEIGHTVSSNSEWRRGNAQTWGWLGLAMW